jgi:hypothetical protein
MPDATYFRQKVQRCRELMSIAIAPEVREQLTLWVDEFEAQAKSLDAQAARNDAPAATEPLVTPTAASSAGDGVKKERPRPVRGGAE